MKEKLKKIDFLTLGIITLITILLCNAFLQMHYSSDTFVLIDLGYMEYPSQYFLLDGRLISTLVCFAAGILHIPYEVYIIGMDIIAIIFVSIAIYITYQTITKIINAENSHLKKVLLLFTSFILILNQFSLEYLLFPESAVMCLGELLCVIAASKVISDTKYKYLKIAILLFFAIFCYQALINIFVILAITFVFLNQFNNKNTVKQNIIEFIKKMLILALICIILVIINIITIKIGCKILNDSSYRSIKLTDFQSIYLRLKTIIIYLDKIWNNSLDMMPKFINSIFVILTLILLIINRAKKEIIFKYIFTILCCLIICIIPMFFLNTGACGRVNVPISQVPGISLLFLLKIIDNKDNTNKIIKKIIYLITITFFVLNSIMILRNSNEHIAANKVDENMGVTIKYMLDEYEKETGITVTKFSYIYDMDPQQYAPGIKHIGSLTERKFACSWCISQATNYYCQRKFEKVRMPINIYIEKIPKKDYTGFSEEQVIFDNDTLYLYVY